MASVELKNVSKIFPVRKGEEVYAVSNFDLQVADQELVVLVGPSGCGKTTTLRLIAGLEQPSAGTILFDGADMTKVPPQDRDVAMVFQSHALYPHMTVFENLAFGLEVRRVPKAELESRIKAAANTLGLTPLLDRRPDALSGGQRQRVALGRAVVRNPKVFLLDEPLSNLDAPLRVQMRGELARLHRRLGATMIYVTHDQAEAMALGQRIAVIKEGTIQQIADPRTLYDAPANVFVAGFIGSPPMNIFRGRILRREEEFVFQENNPAGAANGLRIEISLPAERGQRLSHFAEGNIVLGLRPEAISVQSDPLSNSPMAGVLEVVEAMGPETHLHFNTGAHRFAARVKPDFHGRAGETVPLHFDMSKVVFFNPASETPILLF
jgi:multiple sugar transport system ATP-binding protein